MSKNCSILNALEKQKIIFKNILMPDFQATDLNVITDAIADMTAVYWLPMLAILGILLTISLVPKIIKHFTKFDDSPYNVDNDYYDFYG